MSWARFIRITFIATAAIAAAGYAFLLWIDPYGSGRLIGLNETAVPTLSPRLTNAARARDPAFDAAVIGNSTIQLLNPKRLDALTGLKFVQLTIPGTGPAEQLAILELFARHHPGGVRGIVLGIDAAWSSWCRPGADPNARTVSYPFPFWLYGDSDLDYVLNLPSLRTVNHAMRRIEMLLGWRGRSRADGYNDYEIGRVHNAAEVKARIEGRQTVAEIEIDEADRGDQAPGAENGYPVLERLAAALKALGPEVKIAVVIPPVYSGADAPDSQRADVAACRVAAEAAFAGFANAAILDFRRGGPVTQDIANFWDRIHYRHKVAELMERAIADALEGRPAGAEVIAAFGADPAGP